MQEVVGERQTPTGWECEAIVCRKMWLPKPAVDMKLVRRFRAKQRAAMKVRGCVNTTTDEK